MARTPEPWYNSGKKRWYVWLDGRRVPLGMKGPEAKTRAEARRAFHTLMANRKEISASGPTVKEVIDAFLIATARKVATSERKAVTLEGYTRFLVPASEAYGSLEVSTVRPRDVQSWLDDNPNWGPTTRRNAVASVKAAFRWAQRSGLTKVNPLADLESPAARRRETALSGVKVEAIRAVIRDATFRDFLEGLCGSGCRPGELMGLTAAMLDHRERVWRVPNKTGRATGDYTRTIYPTPGVFARSAELATENPSGPLYRNLKGRPWTRNALACRFRRLRERGVVSPGEVPYAVRHGYVTDALEAGVPVATLAELVGHKDAGMILRVYSHLSERAEHLRSAARQVRPAPDVPSRT